jgi:hypothetical protein
MHHRGADRRGWPEAFSKVLSDGKVLVADRVPEDDALRIISALEGSLATGIETLPRSQNHWKKCSG